MKKLLTLLLSILLIVQMIPLVFAQSNAEVTLTSASAVCGEEVTITVSAKNCVDAKSILILPQYDDEVLEIISGKWLISGVLTADWSEDTGDAVIAFIDNTDINKDIFQFVFKVKDNAQAGVVANVNCEIVIKTMDGADEVPVDATITAGFVTVLAKQCDHTTKTKVPSQSADCVNPGNNLYYICDSCGQAYKADGITETTVEEETIPAMGHDWAAATCTEPKTCSRCNKTEGAALGHDYVATVTAPTCTEKGFTTHTCSRCGDSKVDTYVDALGHTAGDWQYSDSEHWKVCVVDGCGAVLEDTRGNHVDADKDGKCDVCAYAVATQPEPTEPEPTQPEPTQPEPTQPEPTQPEPTEPEPTQPEPTQPETTQPDPSLPETGDSENALLWMALLLTSAMVAAAWVIGRKKSYRA